jgi:outer membrane protein assembly factor BamB
LPGLCLGVAAWLPALAADWPQWRGPLRNGSSPETGWNIDWQAAPPKLLWEVDVGEGVSHPSIAGGKVYVFGLVDGPQDAVQCLDLDSGRTLWRVTAPGIVGRSESEGNGIRGSIATPAVDGNRLFTYHRSHDLRCWDLNGKQLWQVNVFDLYGLCSSKRIQYWTPGNSPLVLGDKVIVSGYGMTGAVALRRETGELVWKAVGADDRNYDGPRPQKGGSNVWTSPTAATLGGRLCVLLNLNRDAVCLDAATGAELWRHQEEHWPGPACVADVLVVGDAIVVPGYSHQEGVGRVLDQQGKLVRRLPQLLTSVGSPAVQDGWLYTSRMAVEAATGALARTVPGEPIVVGGKLIALGPSAMALGELKGGVFTPRGSVPVTADKWTAPVFSSGRILFRSTRTRLACWDARK